MGQEEVPGHVEAGGDGRAEQEGGGLEQGGAEAASINLRKNLDGTVIRDANWLVDIPNTIILNFAPVSF